MNPNTQNSSNVNTILIVLVLVAVVAFGVWFVLHQKGTTSTDENAGFNINVKLPAKDDASSDQSNP